MQFNVAFVQFFFDQRKTNMHFGFTNFILLCSDDRHVSASHVAICRWQVPEYKIYTVQETNIFVLLHLPS